MESSAMAVPVLRAGKHLAKMSGWTYSNLEMQKILYISHMVYLGQLHEPLLEGNFEAWDYGPVHPELYYHLSSYGAKSIPESAFDDIEDLNKIAHRKEMAVLKGVARNFPHPSGPTLIGITHQAKGAWRKRYKPETRGIIISNSDVFEEYEKRYTDQQQKVRQ